MGHRTNNERTMVGPRPGLSQSKLKLFGNYARTLLYRQTPRGKFTRAFDFVKAVRPSSRVIASKFEERGLLGGSLDREQLGAVLHEHPL